MRLPILAGLVLAVSACVGQSGSEIERPGDMHPAPITPGQPGIPEMPHCPCGLLRQMQQIRGTILAVEDFPEIGQERYRLRADEILSDAPDGDGELQVGDEFGGYWSGELACETLTRAPLPVGEEVVAFFRPGLQDGQLCCEYVACSDDCPPPSDGDDGDAAQVQCESNCAAETEAACGQHHAETLLHGELMLIPWGDELLVGQNENASVSIAPSDLMYLALDTDACQAAIEDGYDTLHPPEPPAPNDAEPDETSGAPVAGASAPGSTPTPPPDDAGMAMPPAQMQPPPTSPTPPEGGSNNTSLPEVGPPPAHPEEIRIRCAM